MGLLATTELAEIDGLSGKFCLPWTYRHALGNGMHLANIGVWQACIAASVYAFVKLSVSANELVLTNLFSGLPFK